MTFDAAAVTTLFAQVKTHALTLGIFDRVSTHEPKNAPGNGVSCEIWADTIVPVRSSGLASTSGRVAFHVQIRGSMLQEPQDDIDPALLSAACVLMAEYSGNFTLGGIVRDVDLLGNSGVPLSMQAGYIPQDNKLYRVMVITLPIVINDLWSQVA